MKRRLLLFGKQEAPLFYADESAKLKVGTVCAEGFGDQYGLV